MKNRLGALITVGLLLCAGMVYSATEQRMGGVGDLYWGSGTVTSTGGHVITRINASAIPFSQDNSIKLSALYPFARGIADNGVTGYVLSSNGDNTFSWIVNGSGSMVYPDAGVPLSTGSAWGTSYTVGIGDNNLVQLNGSSQLPAVSAALLTNFPTLNQNTTGTAAGLTAQYTNWSASSGGASVANRPTINGVTVTGAVLDNASNYPTLNQNTTGSAASYSGASGSLSGAKLTDNTVALTKLLTTGCTDNQVAKYTTSGGWACGADATGEIGSGIANVVEDTTPQLGGDLDLNGHVITGFTINGVAVQGTVLDNASNYPTLNQTTTGTAAGLTGAYIDWNAPAVTGPYVANKPTIMGQEVVGNVLDNAALYPPITAIALSTQYIDWDQSSGATSVANRPTIGGTVVTGAVLDNAAKYPTFNQNTTGNATTATTASALSAQYIDWNQSSGATSIANKPTLGTLSALDNGTLTNTKYCIYTAGTGIVCNSTPAGGINNVVEDTTPQLGGTLDLNGNGIDNVSQLEFSYLDGVTSGIQSQINLKANLASPTFTGTVTAPKVVVAGTGGGTIDNTVIGGSTAAAGTFTTLASTTLNTGQGAYELYAMDQNVRTTDNVVFNQVSTGQSATVAGTVKMYELSGGGTNYVALKAADALAGDVTWTLPNADAAGAFYSNGSGAVSLKALGTLGALAAGTMTDTKACIYTTSGTQVVCNTTLGGLAYLDNGAAINITGNAGTASALASDPSDCSAGQLATGIAASGNLTCTATPSGLTSVGATTFTGALTGNASTATALAADPANCSAGQIALGVTAAGVAECTATPSGLTSVGATTFTGALTGNASTATTASNVAVGSDANGDILVRGASAYGRLAAVAAGQPLLSGGASTAPAYAGYTFSGTAAQTYTFPSATSTLAAVNRTKTFSFAIDNVIATDNVLMWRVPVAVTITRADCYATVDNVIGSLMECSTTNATSCTVLDSWTVTNAVNPFSDTSMTDGAVAAGAWVRWSTTSVGTASMNRLSCTVQYNE